MAELNAQGQAVSAFGEMLVEEEPDAALGGRLTENRSGTARGGHSIEGPAPKAWPSVVAGARPSQTHQTHRSRSEPRAPTQAQSEHAEGEPVTYGVQPLAVAEALPAWAAGHPRSAEAFGAERAGVVEPRRTRFGRSNGKSSEKEPTRPVKDTAPDGPRHMHSPSNVNATGYCQTFWSSLSGVRRGDQAAVTPVSLPRPSAGVDFRVPRYLGTNPSPVSLLDGV